MTGTILMKNAKQSFALDKKNQEILQMLIDNSRTPISSIAKKLGLSKPAVLHRINTLKERGIILDYLAYYNLKSFNHSSHMIFLEVNSAEEEQVIESLLKCEFSISIIKIASNFNILWMVYSRDQSHLNHLIAKVSPQIKDIQILPIVRNHFDSYKIFTNNTKKLRKEKAGKIKLDEKDLKILSVLQEDSRKSLVDISRRVSLTAEAIKQRISKMMDNGVILSTFTNFDIFRLGLQPYIILLKTNRVKEDEILNFIREYRSSNGQYVLDSSFGLSCVLVVRDIRELREFIDQINLKFSADIIEYATYLITDQFLNNFLPTGVYESFLNKSP